MDKISTQNLCFRDSLGRTRFFSGMNIDDKLIGQKSFRYKLDEEFFKRYAARGFNLIRLAVTWENIEPVIEKYNESYLKSLDGIFALAEKYGIYILLDMHQDLYSGFGGGTPGDGAPLWASLTDGIEPKPPKFVWVEGYLFGKWVHNCFDHFWNNDPVNGRGLQDRYADMWRMLAARYGNSPALFGFDLLNEPFPGSDAKPMIKRLVRSALKEVVFGKKIKLGVILKSLIRKDMPKLLDSVGGDAVRDIMEKIDSLAEKFDLEKYSPFLNKITEAIREITPNGIIMIEQSFLCNGGVSQFVPPITVNGQKEPLQCFGPHSYDMTVDTPLYKYANADRVKAFFAEMRKTQIRLDVPVIVGEWGGCSDNRDTSWFGHANELLDYFDENRWSQTYWDYHGDDLDSPLMQMLCRTYPIAVAGTVDRYYTDRESNCFVLEYRSDNEGESIIYVHKAADILCDGEVRTVDDFSDGAKKIGIKTAGGNRRVEIRFK